MFTIKVKVRNSKEDLVNGTICFILNERYASRQINTEVRSSTEALTTENLDYVLSGIHRLSELIIEANDSETPVSFESVADKFQSEVSDLAIRTDFRNGFSVPRRLIRVCKPFDKYVSATESKPSGKLTVGNIVDYICCLLEDMKETARPGTYTNYNTALCAIDDYVATIDDKDKEIDGDFITGFAAWSRNRGLIQNTISFYLRTLRTILGKAQDESLITIDNLWFKGLKPNCERDTAKSKEQSLTKDELNRIVDADSKVAPRLDLLRSIFMFSFYCHGMELIDILNLTLDNVEGNYLVYNKRLSGQKETIVLDAPIRKIISRYADKETGVLFNTGRYYKVSNESQSIRMIIKRDMNAIFKLLGINKKFQFSMARNSWNELIKNISLSEIILS